jgi:hypothetical protein
MRQALRGGPLSSRDGPLLSLSGISWLLSVPLVVDDIGSWETQYELAYQYRWCLGVGAVINGDDAQVCRTETTPGNGGSASGVARCRMNKQTVRNAKLCDGLPGLKRSFRVEKQATRAWDLAISSLTAPLAPWGG